MRFDPEFMPRLGKFDDPRIHASPNVIYGMWADFRLAYINEAWFTFAAENRGESEISRNWSIGRSIFEAIPGDLTAFYRDKFEDCLRSGDHWTHEYECSSDQVYRKYHQVSYPLEKKGLIVVNSLMVETAHEPGCSAAIGDDISIYFDEDQIVHQCCHCRRVNNMRQIERWDWVPLFIRKPEPRTTHGICPHCLNHYYPEAKKYL